MTPVSAIRAVPDMPENDWEGIDTLPPSEAASPHDADKPTADNPLRGLERLGKAAVLGRARIEALAQMPVLYIWQDIALVGIIVVIAGGVGCGKTTLLFWILAARANIGAPIEVLGRKVTPAPTGTFIVLIEGEHGEKSAARKLVKTCRLSGLDEGALERIILIARKGVRIGSDAWKDVCTLIRQGLVSDIALDTLARIAPADANDEAQQVAVFDVVSQAIDLAPSEDTKPVVWVNAHTRKGAEDDLESVSGSAQRTGQADTVLLVKAERQNGKVTSSKVTFAKLREDPDDYPMPMEFAVKADTIVLIGARAADDRPLEDRIVERLRLGPQTKSKLGTDLGRNPKDVEDAISTLFAARRITTTAIKVRGRDFKAFAVRNDTQRGIEFPGKSHPTYNQLDGWPDDTQPGPTDSRKAGNHAG